MTPALKARRLAKLCIKIAERIPVNWTDIGGTTQLRKNLACHPLHSDALHRLARARDVDEEIHLGKEHFRSTLRTSRNVGM
jgi:hypothetical protein